MINAAPRFLTMEQCLNVDRGYLVTVNMQHVYEARRSSTVATAVFSDEGASHCMDGRGAAALFRRVVLSDIPLVQGNVLLSRWLSRQVSGRLLVIGSNEATVRKVTGQYPHLETVVADELIDIASPAEAMTKADKLLSTHPGKWDLIAIALGVPKQEMLAQALQHRFPGPVYCVGGSFEILANDFPRSPRWVQAVGLEGVWRLLIEPSRKRIERLVLSYKTFIILRLRHPSLRQLTGLQG